MKKSILLITPENKEINQFRKYQFNNFIQITMPYLAGFIDELKYEISLVDEFNQMIPFNRYFDLVAITVNTPNANHCYEIAEKFKKNNSKIVFGGPHATLLPDEVRNYCDFIIIGEAEDTWPQFLDDFYLNTAKKQYTNRISIQAGIIFGFDTDTSDIFRKSIQSCNLLGIDGVTVRILTPLPNTEIFNQLKSEGRLISTDWKYYNGKTRVAFFPKNMTPQELFDGYMWFRKEFYSIKSIVKRHLFLKKLSIQNLILNLGYKFSIK